ncbi:MAG: hypothetical protein IAB82_06345 [Bacteroidetes bacterium]|uniref:Uncharacterized protein n=1 Tax=Candidatus Cryptobacteroides faecavium TaxID=2840762 RepID=A0A9D9IH39_9BACT|nr:hypothetical protein [Candidatus Cryptobacteroides faecavium]
MYNVGKARQGRTGASARFQAWEPEQRRCRRSEAKPHAPPGLSPQGDWGWTDEGRKTFRAAPERQRGSRRGNRSSEAACPTGAVTTGDWGWTGRIS